MKGDIAKMGDVTSGGSIRLELLVSDPYDLTYSDRPTVLLGASWHAAATDGTWTVQMEPGQSFGGILDGAPVREVSISPRHVGYSLDALRSESIAVNGVALFEDVPKQQAFIATARLVPIR